MLLKIIRLILLCASTYGYMQHFGRKLVPALSIGFTFTSIGSAMFLAGLLNLLPEAALAIFLGGLCCLVADVVRGAWKPSISLAGICFLAMLAILLARLYGCRLIHLDNFTHWALAVKHMLVKNRFPNYSDSYIRFQSYPLGSGVLIYYFAKVSGIHGEWFQMFAHWACAAAMFAGLLAVAKNTPAKLLCFAATLLLLSADNSFDQLLVDSALGFIGLGAVCFCVFYQRELRQKGLYVIPWLTYLISVKNSGALFVVYVLVLVYLWGGFKQGIACTLAPLVCLGLWNKHVSYVFDAGMMAQHAMSLDNYKRMLAAKRAGSVSTVIRKMLGEVFSLSNPYLAILLLSLVLLVAALALAKGDRVVRGLLIYGVACYLIYQVGMGAMYIFTMSEKEAVRLASYDRYNGTILIFSAGVAVLAAALLSERLRGLEKGRVRAAACCLACAGAIAVSGIPHYDAYTRQADETFVELQPLRDKADAIFEQGDVASEASYYILVDDAFTSVDTIYLYNLVNCQMLAEDVQTRKLGQVASEDEVRRCDYLIGFGDDPAIQAYMKDNFGAEDRVLRLK